jgi:hypothetical protein
MAARQQLRAAEQKLASMNSLGQAQRNLELSTAALKKAQAAFLKAEETLAVAEQNHHTDTVALMTEVSTVRGKARVVPTELR